jgi:hypothetical protein
LVLILSFTLDQFFTPNYGVDTGGEQLLIKNYKPEGGGVKFTNTSIQFICFLQPNSPDLSCLSPNVFGTIPPFKAYPVSFISTGLALGIDFILYQKRKISSAFPSVMPVSSRFLLNIQLDESINLLQGSIEINLGIGSSSLTRYQTGTFDQLKFSNSDVFALSAGSHLVGLYYRNIASLEIQ